MLVVVFTTAVGTRGSVPKGMRPPAARLRARASARAGRALSEDIAGYALVADREAVSGSLGTRLTSVDECQAACDGTGYACAGFTHYTQGLFTGECQVIGRGAGLAESSEADFYQKHTAGATFEPSHGVGVPSADVHGWRTQNGTLYDVQAECGIDARCAGFVFCSEAADGANSDGASCEQTGAASALLLSGVSAEASLLPSAALSVYSKSGLRTCGGDADGASCSFPFVFKGLDFYEPTVSGAERPWCYTAKPEKWGYTDCCAPTVARDLKPATSTLD